MSGAVTASSQEAADAGLAVLRRGGNAVDAAVGAALVACVADPCNVGIGGYGGYLVAAWPDGRARCVRFGPWLPGTVDPARLPSSETASGPARSAIPNVVAGLARALSDLGTRSWAELSEPAIALARDGVRANATTRLAFERHADAAVVRECFELTETAGALTFRQTRLARTLEELARHGPGWFYAGPLGDAACRAWRDAGLDVSRRDWADAPEAVQVVPPATFKVDGVTLRSAPLGVSGSACLFGIVAAAARIGRRRPLDEAEALADLAALMGSLWQYRFGTAGGNDFAGVEVGMWVDRALAHRPAMSRLDPGAGHTTHLNVVDGRGTMVAATLTHGASWFGGGWALPDSGVLMNAGMLNLSRTPRVRENGRDYGVSNMAPTVADGVAGARVAIGSPGSRRIPAIVGLALARHAFGGQSLQDAVSAGRLHAEDPRRVTLETARLAPAVRAALRRRFEEVGDEGGAQYYGPLTAIRREPDGRLDVTLDDRTLPGFAAVAPGL